MAEFLQTEAFKFAGEQGEKRVFKAVKAAFHDRKALGCWSYPLVSETTVREHDILMIDPELDVQSQHDLSACQVAHNPHIRPQVGIAVRLTRLGPPTRQQQAWNHAAVLLSGRQFQNELRRHHRHEGHVQHAAQQVDYLSERGLTHQERLAASENWVAQSVPAGGLPGSPRLPVDHSRFRCHSALPAGRLRCCLTTLLSGGRHPEGAR